MPKVVDRFRTFIQGMGDEKGVCVEDGRRLLNISKSWQRRKRKDIGVCVEDCQRFSNISESWQRGEREEIERSVSKIVEGC